MTEEKIAQLADPGRSTLSEREKLALQFAELFLTAPASVTDSFFDELKLHFMEDELVELCFFVGTYNTYHCFNSIIDLKPLKGEELVISHAPGHYPAAQRAVPEQAPREGKAGA